MLPTRFKPRSPSPGFTLAEVMVSLAIMGILFTAAFGAYFLGLRLLEDARHRLRASQIIQSELERLRSLNWTNIQALPSSTNFFPEGEFVAQFADTYTATRNFETVSSNTQLLTRVTVSWTNSRGIAASESFCTVITEGGLSDYLYSIPPGN